MNHAGALNAVQQYKKMGISTEIESASPHRLIQMLMEGALGKIAIAKVHMVEGKLGTKAQNLTWAISIIDGLRISLDKEAGGDIAQNLESLYDYMSRRLMQANASNDVSILDEVTSLIREIKSAWDQIPESAKSLRPSMNQQPV